MREGLSETRGRTGQAKERACMKALGRKASGDFEGAERNVLGGP